jgi:hypothetical protein
VVAGRPKSSEFEVARGNLKRYKLPGSDQSSRTDLSRVRETLHFETSSSLAYSSYSLTIDSFKMIAHSSQSYALVLHLLTPNVFRSSSTQSSHLNLGLPGVFK